MATFTPVSTFEGSERDWSMHLGMLDWDDTRIVFTKRELLEFLKYTGTSVDPNYNNISKLPRYCKFAKVDGNFPKAGEETAAGENRSLASDFVPTRRVRDPPGGKTSISFTDDDPDDALAAAPTKSNEAPVSSSTSGQANLTEEPAESQGLPQPTGVPTRRVREPPGGKDSLKSFWDPAPEEEFRPTRRVREQPGGQDNIGNFY
ncbi:hypothetical protein M408DRAFT_131385 [Serendipita vermifera MAFF 305830]|uniref:Uncharacterized protein n=1 Tax=Serendipita vermifera MAFF 305830 TaxID=933852 RepID=A0A0C2WRA7_SERVB|nr:hypothetical protein M408DRAFT_131385 [Serendipita vermifera MAFF 305830]